MPPHKHACWLLALALVCTGQSTAIAQIASPAEMAQNQTANLPNQNSSFSSPYSARTVSPYLNLGETSYGVSNYHSLVGPLIDERDAVSRQTATIQRLQRQLRDARESKPAGGSVGPGNTPGASSAGRFMYYSHYFGPQRER